MGNTQRWFQMHRRYDCFGAHFARTISRYVISLPTGSEVNHSWLTHEFIREPNPPWNEDRAYERQLGEQCYHASFLQMRPISMRETKSKITFLLLWTTPVQFKFKYLRNYWRWNLWNDKFPQDLEFFYYFSKKSIQVTRINGANCM